MARPKLHLPTVTLCAVTSVNVDATIAALRASLEAVDFGDCALLTDADVGGDYPGIRIVPIERIESASDYSRFMINDLAEHIRSPHCLVVQWDGFVLDVDYWDPGFLAYDYVGAPWPQFDDQHDVGNGGFSLRSRRLLEACRDPSFHMRHPEDLAICRVNRGLLETKFGLRFADRATAGRFAFERAGRSGCSFGFHGIFNMIPAIGAERFWDLYASLDDPATAFVDYRAIMGQLGRSRGAFSRRLRLTADLVRHRLRMQRARFRFRRPPGPDAT